MKQERAAHTRRSLIHSAAQAFEQHGYDRASLAEISASAGVSTGALHFHFTNKAELASTVETSAAILLRNSAATARQPHMDALQQLIATTHALAAQLRHDVVARAGYRLNCETPHHTNLELRTEWQECIHRHLTQAATHHLLTNDTTHHDLTTSITAATIGFEVLARQDPTWLSPTTLTHFWHHVLPHPTPHTPPNTPTRTPAGAPPNTPPGTPAHPQPEQQHHNT
ncbi:ScbR family autoregulator-binding transcription factor [Streptomyces sp. NPDC059582]|uniref:ScbR family autoregulator-binding transcription factor n=1 Tax=Streptomyces sp. NPDC059582 TaxID=3346875 RepID=UPI003693629D